MAKGCYTFSFGINCRANGFQLLNDETLKHVIEKRMVLPIANILSERNYFCLFYYIKISGDYSKIFCINNVIFIELMINELMMFHYTFIFYDVKRVYAIERKI